MQIFRFLKKNQKRVNSNSNLKKNREGSNEIKQLCSDLRLPGGTGNQNIIIANNIKNIVPYRSRSKGCSNGFKKEKSTEKTIDSKLMIFQRNSNKNVTDNNHGGKLGQVIDGFFNTEDDRKYDNHKLKMKDRGVKAKTRSPGVKHPRNSGNIDICNVGKLGEVFEKYFNPGPIDESDVYVDKKSKRGSLPKRSFPAKSKPKLTKIIHKTPDLNIMSCHKNMSASRCLDEQLNKNFQGTVLFDSMTSNELVKVKCSNLTNEMVKLKCSDLTNNLMLTSDKKNTVRDNSKENYGTQIFEQKELIDYVTQLAEPQMTSMTYTKSGKNENLFNNINLDDLNYHPNPFLNNLNPFIKGSGSGLHKNTDFIFMSNQSEFVDSKSLHVSESGDIRPNEEVFPEGFQENQDLTSIDYELLGSVYYRQNCYN